MYPKRFTDFSINRLLCPSITMETLSKARYQPINSSFQTPIRNASDEKSDETDQQNIPLVSIPLPPFHLDSILSHDCKPITPNRSKSQRKYLCAVCKAAFDRPSLLNRHARTHTGEKPFACYNCDKKFATTCALRAHARIHEGVKPYVCKICKKAFTADSNLHYHMFTHKKEDLPHKCLECNKGFATPSELSRHMPIHTNEWPFVCKCGKPFAKPNLYKRHLMKHLGLHDQQCPHCSKKFTIPSKLNDHVKSFHGTDFDNPINDDDVSIETLAAKIAKYDDKPL